MKKEVIKPFDLAKAKAGAKLKTRAGLPVEIFKWDARGDYPIRGIIIDENEDTSDCWTSGGSSYTSGNACPTDLVIVEEVEEPKFKINDWITNGVYTCKIVEVIDNCYKYTFPEGSSYLGVIDDMDKEYRLWTIDDAKDGDVLIDKSNGKECPFIFKETKPSNIKTDVLNPLSVLGYCGIGGAGFTKGCGCGDTANCIYYPATKEQRELLHSKIKEAGYEWDADALELKKIKPEFWSDYRDNTFDGFIINTGQSISKVHNVPNIKLHRDVFATNMQARSALAMARISQIMANDIKNFGGPITDIEWGNDDLKYVICRRNDHIDTVYVRAAYHFLAFHTEEQCDLFLKKYDHLVRDYLMIL